MASNDLNQCSFIGRLGADPEQKFTAGAEQTEVSTFRIAVNWKTSRTDGTEWVLIVAYGKLASICNEYLRKGMQVFVQGRLRTRKWQDKEGRDRYTPEIHLDDMQMLGNKGDVQEVGKSAGAPQNSRSTSAPAAKGNFDHFDDDIPF